MVDVEAAKNDLKEIPPTLKEYLVYEKSKNGVKHDNGKPLIGDMIVDYKTQLLELCKVFEHGTETYGLGNWKQVENGEQRFTNAMIRHLLKEEEVYDQETGLLHAAQVFFNAGARLYFILERLKKD